MDGVIVGHKIALPRVFFAGVAGLHTALAQREEDGVLEAMADVRREVRRIHAPERVVDRVVFARRHDPQKAKVLEAWLEEVIYGFGDRILDVDAQVADEWGRMNAIRPLPVIDALIAATARANSLTFVTRNVSDVQGVGVDLLNPFTA